MPFTENTSASAPLLVSVDNAARLLGGLSARKVWSLISEKTLPTVRIGRRVMLDVADLRTYIDSLKN